MTKQRLEEIFSSTDDTFKRLTLIDEEFEPPAAGALLWEAFVDETIEPPVMFSYWYYLKKADAASYSAADLLTYWEALSSWLNENSGPETSFCDKELDVRQRGELPAWHRDLDIMLDKKFEEGRELFAQQWSRLEGLLQRGLAYALARRGVLEAQELPAGTIDEVALDLVYNLPKTQNLEEARSVFGDEVLAQKLAEYGGEAGPKTRVIRWWDLAFDKATPKQRAQWVLNIEGDNAIKDAVEFAVERFDDADLEALVELATAAPEETEDPLRPAHQTYGLHTAAAILAERAVAAGRYASDDEVAVIDRALRPPVRPPAIDELTRALYAVELETRQELVLDILDVSWDLQRFSLVHTAPTQTVFVRLFEKSANFPAGSHEVKHILQSLQKIDEADGAALLAARQQVGPIPRDLDEFIEDNFREGAAAPEPVGALQPQREERPIKDLSQRIKQTLAQARSVRQLAHAHFGEPASEALIQRVEEEVLGFDMPAELRAVYEKMNGFSVYLPAADAEYEPVDEDAPLSIDDEQFIEWYRFIDSSVDGPVFPDATHRAQALDADGKVFDAGVAYLMPLEAMFFDHDWSSIRYGQDDLFLFDAFNEFYDAALKVDKTNQNVSIIICEDSGAATEDWDPMTISEYLEQLLASAFVTRRVTRDDFERDITVDYR